MAMTVLILDPDKLDYLERYRLQVGGITKADLVRMALKEYMERHPLEAITERPSAQEYINASTQ